MTLLSLDLGRVAIASAAVALGAALSCAPARADAGIGVQFGAQVPTAATGRAAGGDYQTAVSASVDVIKPPIVPLRASIDFDYASSARGAGKLDVFGVAGSIRTTTPTYVGGGLGLYDVAARPNDPVQRSQATVGVGSDVYVGQRILALPAGLGVSLQLDYRALPSAGGVNGGAIGAGLRVHF